MKITEMNTKDILKKLTLEEKASLCSGHEFWWTEPIESQDIPSIMMTDGPHGLRKQDPNSGDMIGLNDSVPSTCFPTAVGFAASWNKDLIRKLGKTLAAEALAKGVSIVLGPGVNIKRSPLCGRNFEYLSEDPYLSAQLAKNFVQAVQEQGVGVSVKHYAVNNQEHHRMIVDVIVDDRALREIYLPAFETVTKEAQPWTLMCAYNRLNGTYCSENKLLLTDLLKEEWGHEGIVITDWGACNDRVEGLKAGLELEMPGNRGMNDLEIVKAVRAGRLHESVLDGAVIRLLKIIQKSLEALKPDASFDAEKHHLIARSIACESMVLLKNEDKLLPLKKGGKIGIIGAFAESPRYQGSGSSHICPTRMDSIIDEAGKIAPAAEIVYSKGYSLDSDEVDEIILAEAVAAAKGCDTVIVLAGLPGSYESEGFDRIHLSMPESHNRLIEEVSEVNKNVTVVLSNGSPVEMPWLDSVKAVLESYLGGQSWGGAVADILFGEVNPSGKLAETFPLKPEDCSSFLNFPGDAKRVVYAESVFVGYRDYDSSKKKVNFPFGYGLSYTDFAYSDLKISDDGMNVKFNISNIGELPGFETAQLYIGDPVASVLRPEKELKGFEKVWLEPGETKRVTIKLDQRSYSYWDTDLNDWYVEAGDFNIMIGASSRDIRLTGRVNLPASTEKKVVYTMNTLLCDIEKHPDVGFFINPLIEKQKATFGPNEEGSTEALMVDSLVNEMPLRNLVRFSCGELLSKENSELLLDVLNGKKAPSVLEGVNGSTQASV